MTDLPTCVLDARAMLGEGPVWVPRDQSLWFVDIAGKLVHRFEPAKRTLASWTAPAKPGWILPVAGGDYVVGLASGPHRFDPAQGSFVSLLDMRSEGAANRLNDAATDQGGALWFGTMDDGESAASGRLYRLDAAGCRDAGLPPAVITNGPAVAPDGRTIYPVDTLARTIHRVEVRDDGSVGKLGVLAEIEEGAGYPDGAVCDSEGCIWIGLFAGWSARRYSPDGELLRTISFPVANVTKIAFGGPDLATVYATTARKGLDAAALAKQPLAGGLFAFDAGVAGNRLAELSADLRFELVASAGTPR